ncbi:MAG: hypothetical protein V7603_1395 [Micromonosporaceae bacterium]
MVASVLPAVRRRAGQLVTLLLALALASALMLRFGSSADAIPRYDVPHDGQLESATGVRFTQAAVVADGGLVELRYVVLDTQKASAFQNDTRHPPTLRNERSGKFAWRAALMKQGHELRPGQSYYLLYLNNQGAIKRGDKIAIDAGQRHLQHVPVR